MTELSIRLNQAIKESGLSHRELEAKTGIPHSAIQRYASGATDNIPLTRLKILAEALGTTANKLLGWDDPTEEGQRRRNEEMLRLFVRLGIEEQEMIVAQMRGLLAHMEQKED